MVKVQIIFWRDIPVQVRVRNGRFRQTTPLSPRFQQAVHRAAYRAKAINGMDYIEEWRLSEWQEYDGEVAGVETAVIVNLEASYTDTDLDRLARNKGHKEY
jgi:hypothetical protein